MKKYKKYRLEILAIFCASIFVIVSKTAIKPEELTKWLGTHLDAIIPILGVIFPTLNRIRRKENGGTHHDKLNKHHEDIQQLKKDTQELKKDIKHIKSSIMKIQKKGSNS